VIASPPARDFGVIIPAKSEHLHWVRGTCASVRHFMGDTPICIILDGDEVPDELCTTYDAHVVLRDEVEPPELRELSFGSLRAKNTALWTSPFDTYLLLDADTVVWGDMRRLADFDSFDFLLDCGGRELTRSIMDVAAVGAHFPDLDAAAHVSDFVNSGAYFGRRGALDLHRYLELVRFALSHPGVFYASQGLFNFMVFSAADEGTVRVRQRELQVMTGFTPREDVVRRFGFRDSRPAAEGEPVVLHWVASPKPRVRQRGRDYFVPMTYFRKEFCRAVRGVATSGIRDELRLRYEDIACADARGTNLRARLARLRRRIPERWAAQLKPALRACTPDRVVAALKRGTS
jgi:hypothetical protein